MINCDSPFLHIYANCISGYPEVISVGAIDCNGAVASFSQQNALVEQVAPGVGILSSVLAKKPDTTRLLVRSSTDSKTIAFETKPIELSSQGRFIAEVVDCGMASLPCARATGMVRFVLFCFSFFCYTFPFF